MSLSLVNAIFVLLRGLSFAVRTLSGWIILGCKHVKLLEPRLSLDGVGGNFYHKTPEPPAKTRSTNETKEGSVKINVRD